MPRVVRPLPATPSCAERAACCRTVSDPEPPAGRLNGIVAGPSIGEHGSSGAGTTHRPLTCEPALSLVAPSGPAALLDCERICVAVMMGTPARLTLKLSIVATQVALDASSDGAPEQELDDEPETWKGPELLMLPPVSPPGGKATLLTGPGMPEPDAAYAWPETVPDIADVSVLDNESRAIVAAPMTAAAIAHIAW